MRDTGAWCRRLEKALAADLEDHISPRRFLQIELAMCLAETVAPGETVDVVPGLLAGYPIRPGHERAIAVGRTLLPALKNPHAWDNALTEYLRVPEHVRGYAVLERVSRRLSVSTASQRFEIYAQTLSTPLPHRKESRPVAGSGTWLLRTRTGRSSVRIPEDLAQSVPPAAASHQILPEGRASVRAIDVGWSELVETARWMDAQSNRPGSASRNWALSLARVRLELFDSGSNAFLACDRLRVDRLLHMVGMVSSGKSTLMDILAVWAARSGRRITLVVGDVVSAVRRSTMFRSLGLRAAPILGRSNRRRHAERLHQILASEGRASLLDAQDPAFDFLSTACAVDGLRDHQRPFETGDHPCESFFAPPEGEEEADESKPHICPFFGACQQHQAARDLMDASIWITTPAALVYTQVPTPILRERLRYVELVYRTQDLVIVDEADQVQVQLDLMFSPHESLFGGTQGSWFDDLEERVGRELRTNRRRPLTDADVGRWVNAVDMARTAGNRIYGLLNQQTSLRKWLDRQHFTEWSLTGRLAREWSGVADGAPENETTLRLREAFREFNLAPLGAPETVPTPLVSLAHQCLTAPDDVQVRAALRRWISSLEGTTLAGGRLESAVWRLEFALLVAVLANRLEILIRMWRQVEVPLRLDGNSVLFHRPPEDFRAVLPDSPMGNALGFQYVPASDDGRDPAGELRFFRCMGVGRWLLLHMHDLFDADGTQGPNVLLLSGTSWAGASPGYHIQTPVGALLRAPDAEVEAIAESRFEFRPFFDANNDNQVIRVSGAGDPQARRSAIRNILSQLAGPSRLGSRKSLLERDIEALPAGRQRVLLLVGSYADARNALHDLLEIQPTWNERAVCLVPDDDEDGADAEYQRFLRRGEVERFGRGTSDILVAPLMAVERGHNILNEEQRAGVGALYLLVRPFPRPDDMSFAVLSSNRRAVEQAAGLAGRASRESVAGVGSAFRREAFDHWRKLVGARMSWAALDEQTRPAVTWNQLVSLWQVIGRLVRGGQPARVFFVDGAYAPQSAIDSDRGDSADTSLLLAMRRVLAPYFTPAHVDARDRAVATALYAPLWAALEKLRGVSIDAEHV